MKLGSERPVTRPEVSAFPLDDDLVLYDASTGEAHILNRTGAFVWKLCDGSHSIRQLASKTGSAFQVSRRLTFADISELIARLDSAGLVTFN
jgi:hypothetical protein